MIPSLPSYAATVDARGLVSLLVAAVLPLLAALLVKQSWSSQVKGLVLLGLAAVKSVGEAFVVQGHSFRLVPVLYAVGINFGVAVIGYFGLLRGSSIHQTLLNTGITDEPQPPTPNLAE